MSAAPEKVITVKFWKRKMYYIENWIFYDVLFIKFVAHNYLYLPWKPDFLFAVVDDTPSSQFDETSLEKVNRTRACSEAQIASTT
jgi:hypothetical protein